MTAPEEEPFPVGVPHSSHRQGRKLTPVAIRLDEETLEQLRTLARDKGIGPTTLARMWILEHLHREHSTP